MAPFFHFHLPSSQNVRWDHWQSAGWRKKITKHVHNTEEDRMNRRTNFFECFTTSHFIIGAKNTLMWIIWDLFFLLKNRSLVMHKVFSKNWDKIWFGINWFHFMKMFIQLKLQWIRFWNGQKALQMTQHHLKRSHGYV